MHEKPGGGGEPVVIRKLISKETYYVFLQFLIHFMHSFLTSLPISVSQSSMGDSSKWSLFRFDLSVGL